MCSSDPILRKSLFGQLMYLPMTNTLTGSHPTMIACWERVEGQGPWALRAHLRVFSLGLGYAGSHGGCRPTISGGTTPSTSHLQFWDRQQPWGLLFILRAGGAPLPCVVVRVYGCRR